MSKITKRLVDGLKPDPAGKDLFVWDSELTGFGIRVKPSGAASYLIQYRTAHGQTRRLAFAKVGTLTPEEARATARDKLGEAAKGADPSAERKAARKAITVRELCDLYLAAVEAGEVAGRRGKTKKASTQTTDRGRIECHVKPLLGSRAVASLTLQDIERFQADVAAGKTKPKEEKKGRGGRIRGGKGAAARVIAMFGAILEFAKRRKIIDANPARGIQKFADGKRQRFLSPEELTKLGQTMRVAAAEGENATGLAAIRFALLSGCRKMEVLKLHWDEVDARTGCVRFTDTKSGPQMRPVGISALDHLAALTRNEECSFVFPSDRDAEHFVGMAKVLARVCKTAELQGVTIHTLRHTFAATAAEMGYSELTIAGLLGHSVPGVTARYAHVPDRALVSAADAVSGRIKAALDRS
ncbi:MAG: site-specific integrase [Magnetospirillum sp.]|nr:site-specific integrase [Magnetospirillum sp.]